MLKGPETPDVYAVLGAVIATIMVTLDTNRKTKKEVISQILGCSVVGAIAPGLLIYWFLPTKYETLTWHSWAFMGLAFGGVGYVFVKFIWYALFKRAKEIVEEQIAHYTGETTPVKIKPKQPDDE